MRTARRPAASEFAKLMKEFGGKDLTVDDITMQDGSPSAVTAEERLIDLTTTTSASEDRLIQLLTIPKQPAGAGAKDAVAKDVPPVRPPRACDSMVVADSVTDSKAKAENEKAPALQPFARQGPAQPKQVGAHAPWPLVGHWIFLWF